MRTPNFKVHCVKLMTLFVFEINENYKFQMESILRLLGNNCAKFLKSLFGTLL